MTDLDRIVALDTSGTGTPLYCVHSSSGSAYSYLGLAQLLDRPVYGVEAPGFDGAREPVGSAAALSAEYADILREARPGGPYLLLGWSLGGILALDMARRLTERGDPVPHVVMVDVSVPHVAPLPAEKRIVLRFLHEIMSALGTPVPPGALAGRPDDAPAGTLLAAAAEVLPPQLDADLLAERYPVFRALVEASYGVEITTRYAGPVTHVIASESRGPHLDWRPVAPQLVEHVVPGDHHSIWSAETLPTVAKLVEAALPEDPEGWSS